MPDSCTYNAQTGLVKASHTVNAFNFFAHGVLMATIAAAVRQQTNNATLNSAAETGLYMVAAFSLVQAAVEIASYYLPIQNGACGAAAENALSVLSAIGFVIAAALKPANSPLIMLDKDTQDQVFTGLVTAYGLTAVKYAIGGCFCRKDMYNMLTVFVGLQADSGYRAIDCAGYVTAFLSTIFAIGLTAGVLASDIPGLANQTESSWTKAPGPLNYGMVAAGGIAACCYFICTILSAAAAAKTQFLVKDTTNQDWVLPSSEKGIRMLETGNKRSTTYDDDSDSDEDCCCCY